jgi:histidine triad (HIT) family protein
MVAEADLESMSPEEMAEYQRQNCVFCKIIKGEIPSRKAYEDDKIISILDINPAAKGHLLVMTKEHYPILPVIPLETSAHMFRTTKHLVKALKEALVTGKATVFIANGAIAGQQSPHFLYHLIPREDNDGLDNFNIPQKDLGEEEIKQPLISYKGKIGLMMKEYHARKAKLGSAESKPQAPKDLAAFIEDNPKIKDMIINNPEGLKKELESNPELKKMFSGININKLSAALGNIKK